eukprot:CAMPEP_0204332704 /NCGR_PEP_ID=MMETSP0469-20131031/16664_1 /ASSEMBLY_ACC=CAM_ASM_000384 /TAXON_ID=2969 /ORGANISM="Oxyrrhis marina" /LENGTH=122 /DNA_ID=CAMNT_0051315899 /DNA_START=10 /DNA_END=378 /DNA_ORIENTATION=-
MTDFGAVCLAVNLVGNFADCKSCAARSVELPPKELEESHVVVVDDDLPVRKPSGDMDLCAVCLENYDGDGLGMVLPACGHVFHSACIVEALTRASRCPVCREEVEGSRIPCPVRVDSLSLEV